jgi:hypothetical protein
VVDDTAVARYLCACVRPLHHQRLSSSNAQRVQIPLAETGERGRIPKFFDHRIAGGRERDGAGVLKRNGRGAPTGGAKKSLAAPAAQKANDSLNGRRLKIRVWNLTRSRGLNDPYEVNRLLEGAGLQVALQSL